MAKLANYLTHGFGVTVRGCFQQLPCQRVETRRYYAHIATNLQHAGARFCRYSAKLLEEQCQHPQGQEADETTGQRPNFVMNVRRPPMDAPWCPFACAPALLQSVKGVTFAIRQAMWGLRHKLISLKSGSKNQSR